MKRQHFSSGGVWESKIGYSRAVRVGQMIFVSGCTAADVNGNVAGDAYTQSKTALETIRAALIGLGAGFEDVVRTRMYLRDIGDWEAVGRAHAEIFAGILPAATMLEVSHFIHPAMLVEIEVDAVLTDTQAV
jgi:enamine deaminase RidA (YjgF/YER057c/UK114 family)